MRGRKYSRKTGPLLVVAEESDAMKAGKNIAGVEVTTVNRLTVEQLAPGTHAGRLTIWTESALEGLKNWS
jgi:large subunit ribosomal protein L4e